MGFLRPDDESPHLHHLPPAWGAVVPDATVRLFDEIESTFEAMPPRVD